MALASPVRFDRLQAGLIDIIGGMVTPAQVGWAYGEGVFDSSFPGDFVNLTMVGGPSYHNQNHARGEVLIPPTLVTLTVDTAVVGKRYTVQINGYNHFYDASAGNTVDDIRDALVTNINADSNDPYTAAPTANPGEFTVTPDSFGAIWQMALFGGNMSSVVTLSDDAVLNTFGTRTFSIAIGCFSKNRFPRNGAWDLAAIIQAGLTTTDFSDQLSNYGVALWGKGPAVDLSDIAGGHWESRVSFDITCAMESVVTRPVDQIETVDFTINFTSPTGSVNFQVAS